MSPLALLYVLFASSPLLNNWHHESTFPSTWNTMPFEHESFEHYTPSFWGSEESTYTPEHLNWLLRKAVRSTEERYPTSIRSIISEMTGRRFFNEEPRMFESIESVRPIVHLIRRIAEVNPIMIEKILSCPVTRRYVEKVLRNVEPETLYMVEKMIRKNVPVTIREKVARRVLKNLLTKSSVFGRRSILSEMYPTEESLFHFHEEPIMTKNLIEKLLRRSSEVPEVVLAKIIRKLVKLNKYSPVEKLFSTRRYFKEEPIRHLIEKLFSTRHFESIFGEKSYEPELILNKVLSKVVRKSFPVSPVEELLSTIRHSEVSPVEKLFSTKKFTPETRMVKKIVKLVKNMKKNVKHTEMPEEFFCNYVCESNTYMRPEFSNMCDEVCHNYESSWESPIFGKHLAAKKIVKLIKKLSKEQF